MRAISLALLLAAGCTQSVDVLDTLDARAIPDAGPQADGGMISELCAHPERFDGMEVDLAVSGITRTDPTCTAVGCDAGAGCCNQCDAYWVLTCPSGGRLAFVQGLYGFSCTGNECALTCDPTLLPSDVLSFRATVHAGGPPTPCCAPERFGVPDARATFDVIDYVIYGPERDS